MLAALRMTAGALNVTWECSRYEGIGEAACTSTPSPRVRSSYSSIRRRVTGPTRPCQPSRRPASRSGRCRSWCRSRRPRRPREAARRGRSPPTCRCHPRVQAPGRLAGDAPEDVVRAGSRGQRGPEDGEDVAGGRVGDVAVAHEDRLVGPGLDCPGAGQDVRGQADHFDVAARPAVVRDGDRGAAVLQQVGGRRRAGRTATSVVGLSPPGRRGRAARPRA